MALDTRRRIDRRRQRHGNNAGGGVEPIFSAPLRGSLIPARNAGSGTPTFSRASTAYVQDHEGVLNQVLANEARFWGFRRVANMVARSQDFTNVAWTPIALTGVTAGFADPFGGTSAQKITDTAVPTAHGIFQGNTGTAVAANNTWTWSIYLATEDVTSESENIRLQLIDGASAHGVIMNVNIRTGGITAGPSVFGSATSVMGGVIPAPNGFYRAWVSCTMPAAATGQAVGYAVLGDGAVYAGTLTGCRVYQGQLENVTGQSVRTPSEPVSTNVLSAPYQGANVDGVQYPDTVRLHTQNLWANSSYAGTVGNAPAGVVQYGAFATPILIGAAETVNGVSTQIGRLRRGAPAGSSGNLSVSTSNQSIPVAFKSVTVGVWVCRRAAVTVSGDLSIADNGGASAVLATTATINAQTADEWYFYSQTMTCRSGATGIGIYTASGNVGEGFDIALPHVTITSPSILPSTNAANYVATAASAVEVGEDTFTTAPIPATTALGYYSEPGSIPAANQVLQSNSFAAAPWAATDMTLTANNAAAPTGGLEATTVAEGVAGTAVLAQAAITITANTIYVASIYAKKVSGFDWLVVRYTDPTGLGGVQGWVNLATGATGTSGTFGVLVGTTFSRFIVYPEADGWYRIVLAGIVDNVSVTSRIQAFSAAADASGVRVNNATYALWTAQLELRHWGISEASTPIITAGAAGTRSVDALSYQATGNFLETSGAAYVEGMPASALANGQGLVNEGPNSRELLACANSGQSGRIIDGAVGTTTSTGGVSWTARYQLKKFAGAWNSTSLLKSVTVTSGTLASGAYSGTFGASITTLRIGMNGGSTFGFVGAVRNVRIFNQTLTDPKLTAMVA